MGVGQILPVEEPHVVNTTRENPIGDKILRGAFKIYAPPVNIQGASINSAPRIFSYSRRICEECVSYISCTDQNLAAQLIRGAPLIDAPRILQLLEAHMDRMRLE